MVVTARGEPHEAASLAHRLEGSDYALERDLVRRFGELESAGRSARGSQDPGAREGVKDLREVVARVAGGGGNFLDAHGPVVMEDGDTENGMKGLASGGGEPHWSGVAGILANIIQI